MEEILEIINTISTTSFIEKFQFISNNANRNIQEYVTQLTEWNLYSEIELIENNEAIINGIADNKNLTRIFNKTAFDSKGNYNIDRYSSLIQLF
jgi:hypothetical protein